MNQMINMFDRPALERDIENLLAGIDTTIRELRPEWPNGIKDAPLAELPQLRDDLKKEAEMYDKLGSEAYHATQSLQTKNTLYIEAAMAVSSQFENEGRGYNCPILWAEHGRQIAAARKKMLRFRVEHTQKSVDASGPVREDFAIV